MSRFNQVVQLGEMQEHIHYYIEDYAYTYLKKQKGKNIAKYFLYGERENDSECEKIYIYGVGEKPKLEQSYFKEYYPVGYLKIKEDKAFWISLKGKEEEITGCFVFYAPNQAMQDYLVDRSLERVESEPAPRKRRGQGEAGISERDVVLAARRVKEKRAKEEFRNDKFILPIGGIICASLILVVLATPNGRKKVEIMKEVIGQTVSEIGVVEEDELIIEEKHIVPEDFMPENEEDIWEETFSDQESVTIEDSAETEAESTQLSEPETAADKGDADDTTASVAEEKEEYVVQNGDTLVAICKARYGSLTKMREICELNGIENADYIAPGQKIYLP